MSLRLRITVYVGLLLICMVAITAASVVGFVHMRQDLDLSARGFQELRQIYQAGLYLSLARPALQADPPDRSAAERTVARAESSLSGSTFHASPDTPGVSPQWTRPSDRDDCLAAIAVVRAAIIGDGSAETPLAQAIGELETVIVHARTDVAAAQAAAERRRRVTLAVVGSLSIVFVLIAVVIGAGIYRSTVRPLRRLGDVARQFAGGQLDVRSPAVGDREFVALADDFNHMAAELQGFNSDLRQKVAVQAAALSRSQRLASVGYLAAGVSHEINNPLGIITGYAERTLRLTDAADDAVDRSQVRAAMEVICEEAFRCKQITAALLSMARPGETSRQPVSLAAVVRQVVHNLAGLPIGDRRQLIFGALPESDGGSIVSGRAGELQQMVLNLAINGLAAVAPGGRVELHVRREANDAIVLEVRDDGRGMNAATLDRIFEPFYSEPRAAEDAADGVTDGGTGLGLSIVQAIVADHGGRIDAESGGLGRGSRFIVRLPAAKPEGV